MGSSPLTRGKRECHRVCEVLCGLIPAHAGKTGVGFPGYRVERAHPRSRGENSSYPRGGRTSWGSSPLTRGKLARGDHDGRIKGLIPAHAGKTTGSQTPAPRAGAHPRSRGENPDRIIRTRYRAGSSPLTRGKHARSLQIRADLRLIPAHAGKTRMDALVPIRIRAHPRSRGENLISTPTTATDGGSSPLTRGKRCCVKCARNGCGLIPAHAGKTCFELGGDHTGWAHPRSRGENPRAASGLALPAGSSPLTRGKPRGGQRPRRRPGLIPAHAGKTLMASLVTGP